jgi:hypothetical protein
MIQVASLKSTKVREAEDAVSSAAAAAADAASECDHLRDVVKQQQQQQQDYELQLSNQAQRLRDLEAESSHIRASLNDDLRAARDEVRMRAGSKLCNANCGARMMHCERRYVLKRRLPPPPPTLLLLLLPRRCRRK